MEIGTTAFEAWSGTNQVYSNNYTYENDRLKTINHNGMNYTFGYDTFGNEKDIKIGSQTLITNNYAGNNGVLNNSVYGNNQTISYTYDRFDRINKKTGTNGNIQYTYDAKGNVKTVVDSVNGTTTYAYDVSDRKIKEARNNGQTTEYTYDPNSNANKATYTLNSNVNTTSYAFDKARKTNENNNSKWENARLWL